MTQEEEFEKAYKQGAVDAFETAARHALEGADKIVAEAAQDPDPRQRVINESGAIALRSFAQHMQRLADMTRSA